MNTTWRPGHGRLVLLATLTLPTLITVAASTPALWGCRSTVYGGGSMQIAFEPEGERGVDWSAELTGVPQERLLDNVYFGCAKPGEEGTRLDDEGYLIHEPADPKGSVWIGACATVDDTFSMGDAPCVQVPRSLYLRAELLGFGPGSAEYDEASNAGVTLIMAFDEAPGAHGGSLALHTHHAEGSAGWPTFTAEHVDATTGWLRIEGVRFECDDAEVPDAETTVSISWAMDRSVRRAKGRIVDEP